jgi:histidyl-tRNA synthetase
MKSHIRIPPGTRILIGRAARQRRAVERAICSVFEGWSYEEIGRDIRLGARKSCG